MHESRTGLLPNPWRLSASPPVITCSRAWILESLVRDSSSSSSSSPLPKKNETNSVEDTPRIAKPAMISSLTETPGIEQLLQPWPGACVTCMTIVSDEPVGGVELVVAVNVTEKFPTSAAVGVQEKSPVLG